MENKWRSFEEAREYVRNLGLKNSYEWITWCKSGRRPADIPSIPRKVYKGEGWINLGDWLGTGYIRPRDKKFLLFDDARTFVHSLELKSNDEWIAYTKSTAFPNNIPAYPSIYYKNKGWKGLFDWLGTTRTFKKKGNYRPFEGARSYIQSLGLKDYFEWQAWAKSGKRPADIPSIPGKVYKGEGWINLGDWLGTGYIRPRDKKFLLFDDARTFVHSLELKSNDEWIAYTKSTAFPNNIPAYPSIYYKNKGWKGLFDWLGTTRIFKKKRNYRPFEEARSYIQSFGLKDYFEWRAWVKSGKRPADIPATPEKVYKEKGWISLGDWLGNGRSPKNKMFFRTFEERELM